MERKAFEKLVEEAVREMPAEFRDKLNNVAIIVEDDVSAEIAESLGLAPEETLFGLYEGVPATERGFFEAPFQPDRILIFQRPIEEACDSAEEIKEELRVTLAHEIAHFFGMSDDYLEDIGY